VATARNFASGNLRSTGSSLDLAVEGSGFFQLSLPGGETGYTRAGMFHVNGQGEVVTNEGYALEPALTIPANATSITISKDGTVSVTVPGQGTPQQVGTLELAQFQNPAGLEARGGNIFVVTNASGDPTTGVPGTDGLGTLVQGFVEDSNVSVVEEMVNMILGQRAYEANSKVIRAADEMLQQVNGLAGNHARKPSPLCTGPGADSAPARAPPPSTTRCAPRLAQAVTDRFRAASSAQVVVEELRVDAPEISSRRGGRVTRSGRCAPVPAWPQQFTLRAGGPTRRESTGGRASRCRCRTCGPRRRWIAMPR
jgi:flagellar basal-body rod protein FlgG